jgi:hypothetical protein
VSHERFMFLFFTVFFGYMLYCLLINRPSRGGKPIGAFFKHQESRAELQRTQLRIEFAWLCYLLPSGRPPYVKGKSGDITFGDMVLLFESDTKFADNAYADFISAIDAYICGDLDEAKMLADSAHVLIRPLFPRLWMDWTLESLPLLERNWEGAAKAAMNGLMEPPENKETQDRLNEIVSERQALVSPN